MIEIILLLLAIPAGLLVSWMARDELTDGRKWFKGLIILFLILSLFLLITGKRAEALASGFIVIMAGMGLIAGRNKADS